MKITISTLTKCIDNIILKRVNEIIENKNYRYLKHERMLIIFLEPKEQNCI